MFTKIRKAVRRWWFKHIELRYNVTEHRFTTYDHADRMIRETAHLPEGQRWEIDSEREDNNRNYGWVYLCKRTRVTE